MKKSLKTFFGLIMFLVIIIISSVMILVRGVFCVGCTLADEIEAGVKKIIDRELYDKLSNNLDKVL